MKMEELEYAKASETKPRLQIILANVISEVDYEVLFLLL